MQTFVILKNLPVVVIIVRYMNNTNIVNVMYVDHNTKLYLSKA